LLIFNTFKKTIVMGKARKELKKVKSRKSTLKNKKRIDNNREIINRIKDNWEK